MTVTIDLEAVMHANRGRSYHLRIVGAPESLCGLPNEGKIRRRGRSFIGTILQVVNPLGWDYETLADHAAAHPRVWCQRCKREAMKRGYPGWAKAWCA